jgi:hypothetical protein
MSRSRRKSHQLSRWNEARALRKVPVKRSSGDTTKSGMPWPPLKLQAGQSDPPGPDADGSRTAP